MAKYDKQYNYAKRESIKFQNARFRAFGSDLTWVNTHIALMNAIRDTNEVDGEKLATKHGVLMVFIKHYVTVNDVESFTAKQIFEYYPHLSMFFDTYANSHKSFLSLMHDLSTMHFLNPHGPPNEPIFRPTMRMRSFFRVFENHNNQLFANPPQ